MYRGFFYVHNRPLRIDGVDAPDEGCFLGFVLPRKHSRRPGSFGEFLLCQFPDYIFLSTVGDRWGKDLTKIIVKYVVKHMKLFGSIIQRCYICSMLNI